MKRTIPCLVSIVLAAAPVRGSLFVDLQPAGAPRRVVFEADARPDPCVTWSFFARHTTTLWIVGNPAAPCPAGPVQEVLLPPLEAGRYTVVARLESGEIWDKASFLVGSLPADGLLIDLAPTTPGPSDAIEVVISSLQYSSDSLLFENPPLVSSARIRFEATIVDCQILCPPPVPLGYLGFRHVLPPLAPGLKTLSFELDGSVLAERSFTIAAPDDRLHLRQSRFEVQLEWRDHAGQAHIAVAEPLTDESGSFWFFDRRNVELTVKILDGRALNGAFWLFAASMTDLGYTLTVTDRFSSRRSVYQGHAGGNQNVIDTALFPD